ncbi:cystathionine gamma-synthase family protein [Litoribacter ruber]|uniref:Cystathionine gamma-synthase family protein n=1 Tax=Litoribacter ruber TaxID=702568 RepID=A0AAP2CHS2_9BACT|nr:MULTISPECIES: cystathionine gamma-synthase family protein [Litoribacter]MBS9523496.1 cystathionine gamma-synthase family protein [Litoribacter alkaliphilus]MBT0812087.1 cystathionine gamma-synthase family protein [Litoribacter ruber]
MHNRDFHPESLMMTHGYKPELSEGAIKCPIFQTSTFVFKNAEEGKAFFEVAYGKREKDPHEELGLIYSRLNNPDLQILEERLSLWDKADECCVFESGMSAISTVMLEFLRPGDVILYSKPVYGGTDHFVNKVLPEYGINGLGFTSEQSKDEVLEMIKSKDLRSKVKVIYIETPANPTNALFDIEMCKEIADELSTPDQEVVIVVDNTYMGPLWQQPLKHGADLVVYSATKYIGGHSDLIAGAVLGKSAHMQRVRRLRTFLGNMAGPWTGWLLMRSLETLKIRMTQQAENAKHVADFLLNHPKVEKVYYLGHLTEGDPSYKTYKNQLSCAGAMVSFDVKGGEKEAFKFLNSLKLMKLAVSLGSTESLAEHPATMTHSDVSDEDRDLLHISDKLVRLSIGVEHYSDIIWDIEQALEQI